MTLITALALEEYVEALRRQVDFHLYKKIRGRADEKVIASVLRRGKRLRPVLLMMVFNALGGRDVERALDVACALELAHNASLAHDDVIDGDFERRGRPSLWRRIGVGRAVIEGHRIINMAFQITLEEGLDIARIFLKAWDRSSSGVLNELLSKEPPSKLLYMRIIKEKTASLFEAAAESGALIAGVPKRVVELARKYGEWVGVAYQLADDYVDTVKGKPFSRFPLIVIERLEEKLKHLSINLKLRKRFSISSIISPKVDWERFLVDELKKAIASAKAVVSEMGVEEPHRTYLRRFPGYCVKSMLSESKGKT